MGLSQDVPPVPNGTMVRDEHLGLSPSGWYNGDVPPVPNGTMVRDGHLGLNPSGWYNGIIPGCSTCTKWYNGTRWTLGIEPLWLVQWDYPGMFHLYQMVRDGHLGLSPSGWYNGDVPPVPNGTMVRDGHLGLNPSGWYNGIIPGCSTCTKWYNGTRWTLGIEPLWLVQWNYPGMFHLHQMVQWYRMDTWD